MLVINAGGIPEIIFDNKNGYIVKTKNHKGLAEKILKLIKPRDNRKLFTDKSYEMFMGKFTVVKIIEA